MSALVVALMSTCNVG